MNWLILSMLFWQNIDPEILEKKSLEARELLSKESLGFQRAGKSRNSKIISRDILFAAYSRIEDKIFLVRLEIVVPKDPRDNSFNIKSITSGFNAQRLAGRGITRFEFKVLKMGGRGTEELLVLDSRQLHLEFQRTSPRDLFYFPYSDIFQHEYFTTKGFDRYSNIIRESQEELCKIGAKSRAYPEKLLCEVFPDQVFLTLGAIEQMDDGEFFADPEYSVKKFLAHMARNGKDAFSYSVSMDGARGLMQFMNSKRIRTYDLVWRKYLEVGLLYNFEKGSADMKNSIKAAICLADINLAQLSKGAEKNFEAIIVAHNAGVGRAKRFLKGRSIPKETQNFLKKYHGTLKILGRR